MKTKIIGRLILLFSTLIVLIPIIILIKGSFEGNGIQDYIDILFTYNIGQNFLNSLFISIVSVAIIVAIVIFAAFAFSKMDFPFKNILYIFILCGLMLPEAVLLVPLFQMSKVFGIINSYWSVIGPIIALSAPFNLLILKNYYDTLPNSLIEAAIIDGCSVNKLLLSIILPLSTPALALVVIWSFLSSWNEYLLPLVFLTDKSMMTVTVVPSWFQENYGGDIPKLFASLVLIVIPIIIVYSIMQKFIMQGLTSGSVKG